MARVNMLIDVFHLNSEELKRIYHSCGTIKKTAEYFGVHHRTVYNWMREYKISGVKHLTRNRPYNSAAKFRKWIALHPKAKLPCNMRKISEITEIPITTIRSYFNRRRARLEKWLKTLPDLKSLNVVIREVSGALLPTKSIESYIFKVDIYTLEILIAGRRKSGGLFKVLTTASAYQKLFKNSSVPPTQHPVGQEHP